MDEQQQTEDNPEALKLEAILFLLRSAKTDEELEQAREKAAKIASLDPEDVEELLAMGERQPRQEAREGDLLRYLREE